MQLRNQFDVPLPPADAWAFLLDADRTVPCFPGAELIERLDPHRVNGRITITLGPLRMTFAGTVHIQPSDQAPFGGILKANWSETHGRGNAITSTRFDMQAHPGGTRVVLETEVQLAGQVAQYGRATGMIAGVSRQLIERFAGNVRERMSALHPAAPQAAPAPVSTLGLLRDAVLARGRDTAANKEKP